MRRPQDVNDAQWQAILDDRPHLLIVAGPGTGKTHTLSYRIARFVQDFQPGKILAITFTRKAAETMRSRLIPLVGENLRNIFIGTFHQWALEILRKYFHKASLPSDFTIAEDGEIRRFIQERRYEKKLINEIRSWKARHTTQECLPFIEEYNQWLRSRKLLDFDDLQIESVRLFENNPPVIEQIRKEYPYIFIDEYQDINPVQHSLLKWLVGPNSYITAIGDPNQAIYGFRGSDVSFFDSFVKDFSPAKKIYLTENYRSGSRLLEAAHHIIKTTTQISVPPLTAKLFLEGQLIVHESPTDKAEAEYVVHQIEKMVGGTTFFSQDSQRVRSHQEAERTFGDIAVLYRLNAQVYPLKEAFLRSGIPFHVSGESNDDDDLAQAPQEPEIVSEKVSLMTLHAAKGMEFPVVFIVGCENTILPLDMKGRETDKEEEKKLFYVGMTRTKERLYLTHAKKRYLFGKAKRNPMSPFLKEIDETLKTIEVSVYKKRKQKKDRQLSFLK